MVFLLEELALVSLVLTMHPLSMSEFLFLLQVHVVRGVLETPTDRQPKTLAH